MSVINWKLDKYLKLLILSLYTGTISGTWNNEDECMHICMCTSLGQVYNLYNQIVFHLPSGCVSVSCHHVILVFMGGITSSPTCQSLYGDLDPSTPWPLPGGRAATSTTTASSACERAAPSPHWPRAVAPLQELVGAPRGSARPSPLVCHADWTWVQILSD